MTVRRALLAVAGAVFLWLVLSPTPASACGVSYQNEPPDNIGVSCPSAEPTAASAVFDAIAAVPAVAPLLLRFMRAAKLGGMPKLKNLGGNTYRVNRPRKLKTIGEIVLDTGFTAVADGGIGAQSPPLGALPYDGKIARQIRPWGLQDKKARGVLIMPDRQQNRLDLYSAVQGPAQRVPGGLGTGLNSHVRSHVEAHAASALREGERGVLYINRVPCTTSRKRGCEQLIPSYLPKGATLTVYGPHYARVFYSNRT